MVMVPDLTLFNVTIVVAESVIITFAFKVFPTAAAGMVQEKELPVKLFVSSMLAIIEPVIVL